MMVAEVTRRDSRVRFYRRRLPLLEPAAGHECGALATASGKYITLLDEGDELAEHALSKLCEAAVGGPELDMLYADEDRLTSEGRRATPFFKPEWSPESLLAWMYIGRPGVYRTSLVRDLGGFRAEFDSAYEYDFALRVATGSPRVRRVADVLYHRRVTLPSPGPADNAARRALQNHLDETDRIGTVEPGQAPGLQRICFAPQGAPVISIIIPSACRRVRIRRERAYYLLKCLESIQKSTWPHYEIVVLARPANFLALRCNRLGNETGWELFTLLTKAPFNWSKAMNQGSGPGTRGTLAVPQ